MMKSFMSAMAAVFVCYAALRLDGTAAYAALSLPPPRLASTPLFPIATATATPTPHPPFAPAPSADLGAQAPLHNSMSRLGRVLGRAKRGLQTLRRDKTAKKPEEPEELWRGMFHNSEYLPHHVGKALAKVLPISRRAAFQVCTRARSEGTVAVMVTDKRQAEKYCGAIIRQGLMATIEPHEVV
mmetsp:Transcript_3729/g.9498  ORF Transcript_3729/g.9498 Transcript_3729/m.9498 type:complete len:184 (+) Transcript_3729:161-712(+)